MNNKKAKEITKTIIKGILLTGGIVIAATSPFFIPLVLSKISKNISRSKNNSAQYFTQSAKEKKQAHNAFSRLMRSGFINIDNKGGQVYISLTDRGKEKAGKYQINDLKIEKPKKWDKVWRILIFDIKNKDKIKREALRGKIKELGLYPLQKSVWVYPYEFQKEIKLLRSFFGLNNDEMQIITASEIEDDKKIRVFFNV